MTESHEPDGTTPFEDHDCGHMPCPPWLHDDDGEVEAVAVKPQVEEPELDPPHHVHDLWAVLGLGEA